ncbi:siderophore-interacting protein [Pseudonocardia sp. TRM90224]|uniref:siderophore-interacting protein n=1 Tax=Pseudonocardia sp. TRM90224 TaxID=2812678 RepID=UPI001E5C69B5|nr:siderophore-interacting protein [Pseudonocardia sp. TRM90224]
MATGTTEFPLEVLDVERLSPSLVRAVLGGGFTSLDVPDEGCVFSFPTADSPASAEGGRWYTVRRCAEGRVTVDLVLHEGGVGGTWAAGAKIGDTLLVTHQNSWFKRPETATWQVLIGDITALPAIGRIIEESAGTIPTTAAVEIPDPGDEQDLGADVTWVHNPDLVRGSKLEELARSMTFPDGPGYVYVAGEAAATRAVRKYLRHELKLPTGSYGVIGYWRVDAERWAEKFKDSGVDVAALYKEAQEASADPEEVRDIYERKLAEVNLL